MSNFPQGNHESIIVVDGNKSDLAHLNEILTKNGYDVYPHEDSPPPEQIGTAPPALIFIALSFPNEAGYKKCRHLKQNANTAHIPIILISNHNQTIDKAKAFEVKANDFIQKPFEAQKILTTLRNQLNSANAQRTQITTLQQESIQLETENKVLKQKIVEIETAQKAFQIELQESEEKFRLAFETSADSVAISRVADGVIVSINRGFTRISGYAPEEVIGKTFADIKSWKNTEDRNRFVEEFVSKGQVQGFEAPLLTKHGEIYGVMSALPIQLKNGPHILATTKDITKQKLAEKALQESEHQYRSLVEGISDLITHVDQDGKFIFVNHMSKQILGLLPNDCVGLSAFQFVHPEDRQKTEDWFNENTARKTQQAVIENRQVNSETGRIYTVLWSCTFYFDKTGELLGVRSIARDISKRKELEAQLLHAQKMDSIGRLAGGIAHDLNNLLVPINGYVELGMMQLSADEKLYTYLKRVKEAAESATKLTHQILAFGRKQILEMQTLDLNKVIEGFKKMVAPLLEEHIDFQTFFAPDIYRIKGDKGHIEQVLMNLVINARDAMPTGGKLTIETANVFLDAEYMRKHADYQSPGHFVMLAISDTGHGIDADTQRQIFDPFFTTKAMGEGTGLGLSTVFGIVKQHGGNIWVYSELEKGTTFKVYFPRTLDANEAVTQPEMQTGPLTGGETVLVVEDAEKVRKLVCETLDSYGYEIIEAKNGTEGMQLVSDYEGSIDLLLTDVIMPDINGRSLFNQLITLQPNLKVLYMSGYTDNVIVHHGVLYEGVNFLQKPFTIHDLVRKIRNVLDSDNT